MFIWSCAAGHVGMPLPCNYMKLADVEEMSYFASNGEGEVGSRDEMEMMALVTINVSAENHLASNIALKH